MLGNEERGGASFERPKGKESPLEEMKGRILEAVPSAKVEVCPPTYGKFWWLQARDAPNWVAISWSESQGFEVCPYVSDGSEIPFEDFEEALTCALGHLTRKGRALGVTRSSGMEASKEALVWAGLSAGIFVAVMFITWALLQWVFA